MAKRLPQAAGGASSAAAAGTIRQSPQWPARVLVLAAARLVKGLRRSVTPQAAPVGQDPQAKASLAASASGQLPMVASASAVAPNAQAMMRRMMWLADAANLLGR